MNRKFGSNVYAAIRQILFLNSAIENTFSVSSFRKPYHNKVSKNYQRKSYHQPHQGSGEKARRVRQMKTGFLRVSHEGLLHIN